MMCGCKYYWEGYCNNPSRLSIECNSNDCAIEETNGMIEFDERNYKGE